MSNKLRPKGEDCMNGEFVLFTLILIGLISRSPIITIAACTLLIIKLIHLDRFLPLIERRGLELGLLCLTIAVLVPLAAERIIQLTHYGQPYPLGLVYWQ